MVVIENIPIYFVLFYNKSGCFQKTKGCLHFVLKWFIFANFKIRFELVEILFQGFFCDYKIAVYKLRKESLIEKKRETSGIMI